MSMPPFSGRNPEDNSGLPQRPSHNPDASGYATPESPYAAAPQYDQSAPVKSRKKVGLVVGASVLSLAVLAGGGFAAASILNNMSDHDISVALPQSTSAFMQADLDPSPGQKINLASVAGKIKDIGGEKNYDTNKDPKEMFTDLFFSDLDYKTEVEPWVGDKVAFGAWGDLSKVADDTASGSDASDELKAVVVYEIKDKAKADEAAKKMDSKKTVYEVNDNYLIIAPNQAALDSYNAEIEKGTLDKNKTFTDDRNLLNGQDNVAVGWVNATEIHADKALNKYMSKTLGSTANIPENLSGRMVTGITLSNNSLKVSSKFVGFDTAEYSTEKGLTDVGNLPDSTNIALSFKDGKTAATKAWNTYTSAEGSSSTRSIDRGLQEMGISLPDDFGALLGTETSIGASLKGNNDHGVAYRAKDGDEGKISSVIEGIDPDGANLTTTNDEGAVVVEYGENDNGKLSDSQAFKNVTGDLSNAQAVFFVDLNKVVNERAKAVGKDPRADVNYGVAGMTSSFDQSSKIVSVDINWAF